MNRPFEMLNMFRSYWNQGWRSRGTMVASVPHALTIAGVWIHASPLLEECGMVDLVLLCLLFVPTPAVRQMNIWGRRYAWLKVRSSPLFFFIRFVLFSFLTGFLSTIPCYDESLWRWCGITMVSLGCWLCGRLLLDRGYWWLVSFGMEESG